MLRNRTLRECVLTTIAIVLSLALVWGFVETVDWNAGNNNRQSCESAYEITDHWSDECAEKFGGR